MILGLQSVPSAQTHREVLFYRHVLWCKNGIDLGLQYFLISAFQSVLNGCTWRHKKNRMARVDVQSSLSFPDCCLQRFVQFCFCPSFLLRPRF